MLVLIKSVFHEKCTEALQSEYFCDFTREKQSINIPLNVTVSLYGWNAMFGS